MKDATLISVVTPIYNGARFIKDAYGCLCRQTYPNWEWVVVDDGSTDETREMIRHLGASDRRISYTWQPGSGAAKLPRDRAVFQSRGELLLPLDIDDRLDDDYLQRMLERMTDTNADIVYPKMVFVDIDSGKTTQTLPHADFDTSQVYEGRRLVKETIPEWHIGCNGGLYRRQVWGNIYWLEEHEPIWVYSDEVDERHYLLLAHRVVFADTCYYYQKHDLSITKKISPKIFHVLKTNNLLLDLIQQHFGTDSEEYRLANQKVLYGWHSMAIEYLKHFEQLTDADGQILIDLRQAFARIDVSLLAWQERLRFLNLCNEKLLLLAMALRYSPKWIAERIAQHLSPSYYHNTVLRKRSELAMARQIRHSYENAPENPSFRPYAISMFCGNIAGGGLVDRLRGAISLYAACKEAKGHDFKLYFTHPFPLADYLQPNVYDWTMKQDELTFAPTQAKAVIADTMTDTRQESERQRQHFIQQLHTHDGKQLHFYSNAIFSYDQDFAALFAELFRPSARLQASIDKAKRSLGSHYITVSARFCNLLDDFNEETYSEPLPRAGQKLLLDACLGQVERLHHRHRDELILICSDSETFAQKAQTLTYVRVIPGTVSHIGNDTTHHYEYYEKTFIDFFLIAQAQKAYLLKSAKMHNSGFPYAAARVGRKSYEVIAIDL